jgi:hypothetical protein
VSKIKVGIQSLGLDGRGVRLGDRMRCMRLFLKMGVRIDDIMILRLVGWRFFDSLEIYLGF